MPLHRTIGGETGITRVFTVVDKLVREHFESKRRRISYRARAGDGCAEVNARATIRPQRVICASALSFQHVEMQKGGMGSICGYPTHVHPGTVSVPPRGCPWSGPESKTTGHMQALPVEDSGSCPPSAQPSQKEKDQSQDCPACRSRRSSARRHCTPR